MDNNMEPNNFNNAPSEVQPQQQVVNSAPVQQPAQNNKKKKSKLVFILIPIILVVIAAVGIILFKKPGDSATTTKKGETKFDINAYIPFQKNALYGYMNTNGKTVIEPKYTSASAFVDGNAVVSVVDETGFKYQIIDKKGKVKIEYKDDYKVLPNGNFIIDDSLYSNKYKKLSDDKYKVKYNSYDDLLEWTNNSDNSWGIMNTEGKVVYTYKFKTSSGYASVDAADAEERFKDRYCMVKVTDDTTTYGIINCNTGKVAYNFTENRISEDNYNTFVIYDENRDYVEVYVVGDKVAFTSRKNSSIYTYDSEYFYSYDDDYNRLYISVATGKTQTDTPKSTTSSTSKKDLSEWEKATGYEKITSARGNGLISGTKVVVPCEWDRLSTLPAPVHNYLTSINKGYVIGKNGNMYYLVNIGTGESVSLNTTDEPDYYDSVFIKYDNEATKEKIVYSLIAGKTITSKNSIEIGPNYIIVKEDGQRQYYNSNLKLIYTEE